MTILPVKSENIPNLLKSVNQWVVWKSFKHKSDGRFDKVPICPASGKSVNGLSPVNQLSFELALKAYQAGFGDGIGIALTGKPLSYSDNGAPLYLIGIDLDKVTSSSQKKTDAKAIYKLIQSYTEISPSGTGLRIFALSNRLVGKNQSAHGEMYNTGRFLTVTGHGNLRKVRVATAQLEELQKAWWPDDGITEPSLNYRQVAKPVFPDTPYNRANLLAWLSKLSADCSYQRYRNVVWSIVSTNWEDAEKIAYNWCISAPDRFNSSNFEAVVRSYNADHVNPITVRSLAYWSKRASDND